VSDILRAKEEFELGTILPSVYVCVAYCKKNSGKIFEKEYRRQMKI